MVTSKTVCLMARREVCGSWRFNLLKFELSVTKSEEWLVLNRNKFCTFDSKNVYTARLFFAAKYLPEINHAIAGHPSRAIEQ